MRLGHLMEEPRLGAGVRQGPAAAALPFVLGVELVAEGQRAGLQLGDAALALRGLFGRTLGVVRHHQPTPEPQGFVHRLGGRGRGVARCSLRLRARGFGNHLLLEAPQHGFELAMAAARHEMIAIPPGALRLLVVVDMLTQLGQGRAVTVLPQNAELTTQEVADYLNVSRPYVVKLIEEEKLPARKVGTRRRVAFDDLLRFDEQQRARQRAALDELARIDTELGL